MDSPQLPSDRQTDDTTAYDQKVRSINHHDTTASRLALALS
jgi:hypothetical protein